MTLGIFVKIAQIGQQVVINNEQLGQPPVIFVTSAEQNKKTEIAGTKWLVR